MYLPGMLFLNQVLFKLITMNIWLKNVFMKLMFIIIPSALIFRIHIGDERKKNIYLVIL